MFDKCFVYFSIEKYKVTIELHSNSVLFAQTIFMHAASVDFPHLSGIIVYVFAVD